MRLNPLTPHLRAYPAPAASHQQACPAIPERPRPFSSSPATTHLKGEILMNNFTFIHSQRLGRHRPLLLVLLGVLTFSSHAFGVAYQPNDEVHLTRDTPLLFLDKPLRQGTTGETFKVLAYQPEQKKVFLAAKDPAGKEIAVSVAEESVSLVPADKAKVQADVLDAVSHQQYSHQQYAVAKTLLDSALRASPDDVDLHNTSVALEALVKSATQLNQMTFSQNTVATDLQRRRRNADVTDHPNPLDTRDQSGRQRAAQMRTEAKSIEAQSIQSVRTAQANYDASLSAFKAVISSSSTAKLVTTGTQAASQTRRDFGPNPGAPSIPKSEKPMVAPAIKPWSSESAGLP